MEKRRGTLPAVEVMEDAHREEKFTIFEYPRGLLYRVALDDAARAGGAVDLRISIEDSAGNATEWTMEPGLVVAGPKRRASR